MALPSQRMSGSVRGRHMYRRRKKRPSMKLVVPAVIIVGSTWWYLSEREESNPEPAAETAVVIATPPASEPLPYVFRGTPISNDGTFETTHREESQEQVAEEPSTPPNGWQVPTETVAVTEPPVQEATMEVAPAVEPVEASTPSPAVGQVTPTPPASTAVRDARGLLAQNNPVAARTLLSEAVATHHMTAGDREEALFLIEEINQRLVFSSEVVDGDPFSFKYTVKRGDSLGKIAKEFNLHVNWRFLQRINGLKRPDLIQVGQTLKIVTGPFHADIDRTTHTMKLYLGDGDQQVYVKDYAVGLGAFDSTPSGLFRVRPHSKLVNPPWTNPRTREHFTANDPSNPIGEFWLGLEGIEDHNRQEAGFGIHGTIDPDSIGQNESMGCVRLPDGEIDVVYEVLTEGVSTIWINELLAPTDIPGG